MATRSYTSRRELDEHTFHPAVTVLVPVGFIILQALLPRPFPKLAILDLPLIATIFFAVGRRSPIAGTLTGAAIGLLQDALTNQYIGINGITKALIGYTAASIGFKVDVESITTRILMIFGFTSCCGRLSSLSSQSPSSICSTAPNPTSDSSNEGVLRAQQTCHPKRASLRLDRKKLPRRMTVSLI
jgi:rod shape-determining protein MreD